MLRSTPYSAFLALAGLALSACGGGGDSSPSAPPAEPQARLLIDEGGDTVRVQLDSSLWAGLDLRAELRATDHPWSADSIAIREIGGRWEIGDLPDGPWRVEATLRDATGRIRATGARSFLRRTPFALCGHELTLGEWVGLLGGNLVVVAGMNEGARSGRDVVREVLAAMTLASIDRDRLARLQYRFSGGVYRYGTDPERVETQFAFVAAQAFGPYAAGDTLRENIAELSSFVKNIDVSLTHGLTWDRGPLFGLIRGSVTFDGRTPSFEIDPSRISLTLATRAQALRPRREARLAADSIVYTPLPPDSLVFRLSLLPTPLRTLREALDDGTLAFGIDGTTYRSHADGILHDFHHSRVELYDDSAGTAQFQGSYLVAAASGNFRYHQRGVISSVGQQSTLFACDEALVDTLGVAYHARDLTHGSFVTARGVSIPYGLVPF